MGKIHLLKPEVIKRISAAQVVGSPCDVVKELVENSIDAGATKITVEIENGGISKIRVFDDGCGISREDVKTAFMSHATSKISTTEDIDAITTLGFRGEALASIANVSRVTVLTKTLNEEVGTFLEVEDGKFSEIIDKATNVGTAITVYNLFAHVPARKKYLRSVKIEEMDVTKIMRKFVLAHPEVAFIYLIDGVVYFQSAAGSLKDAMFTLYGQSYVDQMIEVNDEEDFVEISGYIVAPPNGKPNETWQTVFVNGRWVESDCVKYALRLAYGDYLMRGVYPTYILNLKLPYEQVDINASPDKTKVRFVKDNYIHGIIYRLITKAIEEHQRMERQKADIAILMKDPSEFINESDDDDDEEFVTTSTNKFQGSSFDMVVLDDTYEGGNLEPPVGVPHKLNFITSDLDDLDDIADSDGVEEIESNSDFELNSGNSIINKVRIDEDLKRLRQLEQMEMVEKYKVVGTLFSTYIVIEKDDNIILIDQHAAHERMLFDKFLQEYENSQIIKQPLLSPYIFTVNHQEENFLNQNMEYLNKLGFDIQPFGFNTYKVDEVPSILINLNFQDFFNELFSNLSYFHDVKGQLIEKLATKACRAAVKSGQTLSTNEIETLLKMIKESKTPLLCPHGRPYIIQVVKYELEKLFKRKV